MISNHAFSIVKIFAHFSIWCAVILLTACSPMRLPFVIVNDSEAAATVKYHLINCYGIEYEKWQSEYVPVEMNAAVYFSNTKWEWKMPARNEFEMTENSFSADVEGSDPKVQRSCVERSYTINLPAKTALRIAVGDSNPTMGLDSLEISGTRGAMRFEQINVWRMFRNIDRNYDRIGERFHAYDIIYNQY